MPSDEPVMKMRAMVDDELSMLEGLWKKRVGVLSVVLIVDECGSTKVERRPISMFGPNSKKRNNEKKLRRK